MSKDISEIRKTIEKEAFDFFNFNNSIKTKDEVDKKLLSIRNDYKREISVNTLRLTLCFLMIIFSLWQIINVAGVMVEKPTITNYDIYTISVSIAAFIFPVFLCFYLLSSRKDSAAFNSYINDYYNPVNIDLPRIAAGISNMLLDCESAVINKEILAQGRSVTLAEHLLMWKMYQESDDFLNKKEAVCNIGLVTRKNPVKQEGNLS